MQLTRDEIIQSAYNFINHQENDGYLSFLRFSRRQLEQYAGSPLLKTMSLCSPGVYLGFETDGDGVSLQCRPRKISVTVGAQAAAAAERQALDDLDGRMEENGVVPDLRQHFDLWVDGEHSDSVPLKRGTLDFSFANPGHEWREVKIWFPLYSPIEIGGVSCRGQYRPLQNTPARRLYTFGDSITQGYLVNQPSHAYAHALARLLPAGLLNQGIAGGVFDPHTLPTAAELPTPDLVTVCYGTNDWFLDSSMQEISENAAAYLGRLRQLFPGSPVFVITPLWRGDMHSRRRSGSLSDVIARMAQLARQQEGMYLIDGLEISPPSQAYYGDGFLHPNCRGHDFMAPAILRQISHALGQA